jgi:hypothetical protein
MHAEQLTWRMNQRDMQAVGHPYGAHAEMRAGSGTSRQRDMKAKGHAGRRTCRQRDMQEGGHTGRGTCTVKPVKQIRV